MRVLGIAAIILGVILMLPAIALSIASAFVYIVGVTPSWTPALLTTLAVFGILSALYGVVILRRLRRN